MKLLIPRFNLPILIASYLYRIKINYYLDKSFYSLAAEKVNKDIVNPVHYEETRVAHISIKGYIFYEVTYSTYKKEKEKNTAK